MQNNQGRHNMLQENSNIRFGSQMSECQDNSFDDSYIELDLSNHSEDVEILQNFRCETTEKDLDIIELEDSDCSHEGGTVIESEPINPAINFNNYQSTDGSRKYGRHNIRNNRMPLKSFPSRPHFQRKNLNIKQKNYNSIRQGNKDYHLYQEEILNSFLFYPLAADKLHETVDKNYTIVMQLKKGLCWNWIQTEACDKENCAWSHEPRQLFEKRLHSFPNLDVINIVLSMQFDEFYLDALMEGFAELIRRDIPEKWIRFLVFYIFTKTESLLYNFFEFWSKIAEYFCIKKNFSDDILGFVELLNLFANVNITDRWKVLKFIELFKSCKSEFKVTYQFLKPILHFDLSLKLLIEAVESSSDKKVNLIETLKEIYPKINVQHLPLDGVEILLKFLDALRSVNREHPANRLKISLTPKVLSLPSNIDENAYPLTVKYFKMLSNNMNEEDEAVYEEIIKDIAGKLTTEFDFTYFTTKLNEINEIFIDKASEAVMKILLSMDFSPNDIIDLLDITIFNASTRAAKKISASMSLTFIYGFVIEKDWQKAYSILELCDKKNVDLINAKIIEINSENMLEQHKIVFLLAEIYLNNEKYDQFIMCLEQNNIFSPVHINWGISRTSETRKLSLQMIDNFFKITFSNELIDSACNLFFKIWRCQKKMDHPIDLRPYTNEIILGLISQKKRNEVLSLVPKVRPYPIKPAVVRSFLVYLVQEDLNKDAEQHFAEVAYRIYNIPKLSSPNLDFCYTITVDSTCSEEELLLIFNYYFYKLMRSYFKPSSLTSVSPNKIKVNISVKISTFEHDLYFKPRYLMEVDNSEDAIKSRVEAVLENKINPPLKTFSVSSHIFIEAESLYRHLHSLFNNFKTF